MVLQKVKKVVHSYLSVNFPEQYELLLILFVLLLLFFSQYSFCSH